MFWLIGRPQRLPLRAAFRVFGALPLSRLRPQRPAHQHLAGDDAQHAGRQAAKRIGAAYGVFAALEQAATRMRDAAVTDDADALLLNGLFLEQRFDA